MTTSSSMSVKAPRRQTWDFNPELVLVGRIKTVDTGTLPLPFIDIGRS